MDFLTGSVLKTRTEVKFYLWFDPFAKLILEAEPNPAPYAEVILYAIVVDVLPDLVAIMPQP